MTTALDGYWPSPWPGEDGGPTRQQTPPPPFSLDAASLVATPRQIFGANMIVLREPGEVFLQGNTFGLDTTAWVERIDPLTLEPLHRSPDLAGGPFWAGGIAAHRNGSLYVTYGRWCHRLDAETLQPIASRELPRNRPYNSLLILPDGNLVMKDFCGGAGDHAITNGDGGSQLVVLEPDRLEVLADLELSEGSIARLSGDAAEDGAVVYVVGDGSLHAVAWNGTRLRLDGEPCRYLTEEGRTFGWDAVITDGSAWFLDDGEGTRNFGPSFRGKGVSTAPLRLVRITLGGGSELSSVEVCGRPGGIIANPPLVDATRKIAVGYDSGNSVLAAWRYATDGFEPLWRRDQDHAGHMLFDATAGLLLSYDYDHDGSEDHAVVLDITTGDAVQRVGTGSPVQTVVFPAPGWNDDCYVISFTTVTRLHHPH